MEELLQQFNEWLASRAATTITQFVLWSVFILLIAWFLRTVVTRTISDNTNRYRAKKAIRLAGYFLILLLAVATFTGRLEYLGISIGFISAGIAFALQEVILSIAGWIAIFSTNLYKPGDRIEINGVKGDVIDISVTQTTLMEMGQWVSSDNYNGRIVRISNAFVFKSPLYNYSTDFPFLWDEIMLPVRYQSDTKLAGELIMQVAHAKLSEYADYAKEHWSGMVRKYLIENAMVEPTLSVKLTDNWVEFTLRFVVDYKKRRTTKNELSREILEVFQKTKGKVELASATFELVGLPNVSVDLRSVSKE